MEGLGASPAVVQTDYSSSSDLFLDPFSWDWEPLCFIITLLQRLQLFILPSGHSLHGVGEHYVMACKTSLNLTDLKHANFGTWLFAFGRWFALQSNLFLPPFSTFILHLLILACPKDFFCISNLKKGFYFMFFPFLIEMRKISLSSGTRNQPLSLR